MMKHTTAMSLIAMAGSASGQVIFSENFDGLAPLLQPAVNENIPPTVLGWTDQAPAGWSTTDSLPTIHPVTNLDVGVDEWEGWSFATREFWLAAADQRRSEFTKASGVFAIADPDEYDDNNNGNGDALDFGTYNTFLETPAINLGGAAGSVEISFDSSWRPEDTQAAFLEIAFDGGAATRIFTWSSDPLSSDFKDDNSTNESLSFSFAIPSGASTVQYNFGMIDATNDWWWAIDNIAVAVPAPASAGLLALAGMAGVRRRR